MARVQLGPLAATISGRVGDLLFRRTRYGTVVQKMHPVRNVSTDAQLVTRDRFRIAARTWSVMPKPLRDDLLARQRSLATGSPGPFAASTLNFLAGDAWRYAHCSDPSIDPGYVSFYINLPNWTMRFKYGPQAPFNSFHVFFFVWPPHPNFTPRWTIAPWSSPYLNLLPFYAPGLLHAILIPRIAAHPERSGQGVASPLLG
ncbi:hypothetical protein ES705_27479 [subsurface metagenome]